MNFKHINAKALKKPQNSFKSKFLSGLEIINIH